MSAKLNNDTGKTLKALQEAGSTGVHSFYLNHIVGTTRAAARINDLKKLGYQIDSKREKIGDSWGSRYTLRGAPIIQKEPQVRYEFDNETNTCRLVYI